ncbi:MAG: HEAT repeat domain-containing protein [Dehalococcoidia bacterium]|nr:HEAT repeat domain-containing protein [Dehalococcoidia bacterium]
MVEGFGSFIELLTEIFSPAGNPSAARLLRLSNLDREEMALFKEHWHLADDGRRRELIAALAQLSRDNVEVNFEPIFRFSLASEDSEVKLAALIGLEESEDYRLVPELVRMLDDPASSVRQAVAAALGRFALLAETGKIARRHGDEVFRALVKVVNDPEEVPEVRAQALQAVAVFSVPEVRGLIERAYAEQSVVLRAGAIVAMGRTCDTAWLPSVIKELTSDRAELRRAAALASGELESEEAVPHLIRMTRDEVIEVKEAAIAALGEIGGEVAKKVLENLTRSPVRRVSEAARAALAELSFWESPMTMRGDTQ